MTLAPSYSPLIPFPAHRGEHRGGADSDRFLVTAPAAPTALALESATVDVTELVDFAARLDVLAARDGESVSATSIVAKAFLVASLRHPGVVARWPMLPARHGLRLSELTTALEGAEAASPIPADAAILSVGTIAEDRTVSLNLAFDPRRTDAVVAHRLLEELAALLADPWELIAHC